MADVVRTEWGAWIYADAVGHLECRRRFNHRDPAVVAVQAYQYGELWRYDYYDNGTVVPTKESFDWVPEE